MNDDDLYRDELEREEAEFEAEIASLSAPDLLRRAFERVERQQTLTRAALNATDSLAARLSALLRSIYAQGMADMLVGTSRFVSGEGAALNAALDQVGNKSFATELAQLEDMLVSNSAVHLGPKPSDKN